MTITTIAPSPPRLDEIDRIIVLEGATWADYERLLEIRGERSAPRMAFNDGMIELMSPSSYHEKIKSLIGCLVEAWCLERDVDFTAVGSWLLKDKVAKKGLEPDECYVFADIPVEEGGRPDLAIEVVWTSGGIHKLEIYRALGVPEVWIWKNGVLTPYRLGKPGYRVVKRSHLLREIDLAQLASFIDVQKWTSRVIKDYRAALRGDSEA